MEKDISMPHIIRLNNHIVAEAFSPAPELVTFEDSWVLEKDISLPRAAMTDIATECFYIGDDRDVELSKDSVGAAPPLVPEDATATYTAALEERIANADVDHDLIILGAIQLEKRVFALENAAASGAASLDVVDEEECLDEPGICKAIDTEELEPFTAAQHSEINRIFTNTFAGFIDQIIGKVQNMITNEMQTSFDPVCCDLRNQIELLRNEILYKLAPMQIGMKRYSFKRKSDNLHDQNEPNLVHDSHVDNNLVQFDQLHVEDGPNLVRYFEQLVREEVSSYNLERLEPKCLERLEPKCLDSADSAHDWTGPIVRGIAGRDFVPNKLFKIAHKIWPIFHVQLVELHYIIVNMRVVH